MFAAAVAAHGERPAVISADEVLTYRELDERSDRLARALLASGASRGSIVAVLSERTCQVAAGILACLKAGCAFMPLDPDTPVPRLSALLAQVPPDRFLAGGEAAVRIAGILGEEKAALRCLDPRTLPVGDAPPLAPAAWEPDDLAYVFFTSGSTGSPKGIAGRLKAIDHFVRWEIEALGLGPELRSSQLVSSAFDAVLRDLFVPLCAGGAVCAPPDRGTVLDASRLIDWVHSSEVQLIHCVPSLWRTMLNESLDPSSFAALRHVLLAGERLLPADVGRWVDLFGDRIQLVNLYGPSETTMTKLVYFVRPEDRSRPSIPIGKPMPGAGAALVDSRGKACPPFTVGEIYIRTPFASLGYLNQPELTRQAFVQNPFSEDPGDRVYRTGDLGRVLEDGNFEFLGRRDGQVKIHGVRVELGEIESALRENPAVDDVAVVEREDRPGAPFLCAYVVLGAEIDHGELRVFLSHRLLAAMIPSRFIRLDQLPRTLTGKVDRRALPAPEALDRADRGSRPARTQTEELLAAIWSTLLGVEVTGCDDNFFELGGHSLLATRLLSRVKECFAIEVPLQTLFAAPTLGELASRIDATIRGGGRRASLPPLSRVSRSGPLPLSFAQQRLWLLESLRSGTAAYNIPAGVRLAGPLALDVLRRALGHLAARHEALRTSFAERGGVPVQRIAATVEIPSPAIDLSTLAADVAEREAQRIAAAEAQLPFDLGRSPLLRVWLLRLGMTDHAILFTMHHIVSDAWSIELLISEVAELYSAAVAGREPALPEMAVQYVDFAAWQRQWLEGEVLESQLAFWRRSLAGSLPELALETDFPRPAVASPRGRRQIAEIPASLVETLRQLGRREGATLYMTLLAAFYVLLHRGTGQSDILVGTAMAGRNHPAAERLIGFFVNMLPLRADLSGDPSFRAFLARVRRTAVEAFAHQELPFDKLVEELRPERRPGINPFFQVAFGLRNLRVDKAALPGIELRELDREHDAARFDLTVWISEGADATNATWSYSTDLFGDATIARMHAQFEGLLAGIAEDPDGALSSFDLLTAAEHERRLAARLERDGTNRRKLRTIQRRRIIAGGPAEGPGA
jgi:amino acid adenylation domain-containing protein